jgi:hypothetical protein
MSNGLIMLRVCEIISSNREDGLSSFVEPDDSLGLYIDFLEKLNPYDWINDFKLIKLCENVFSKEA